MLTWYLRMATHVLIVCYVLDEKGKCYFSIITLTNTPPGDVCYNYMNILNMQDFTNSKCKGAEEDIIRAGLQNSLLLFIKHSSFVFMINPSKDSLSMQVWLQRIVTVLSLVCERTSSLNLF